MLKNSCRFRRFLFQSLPFVLVLPAFSAAQQVPVAPVETPTQQQTQPAKPAQPANPQNEQKPNAQVNGPGAPVDSTSYKVGPADILSIRVWDEPQFSGPVIVQQNGNVTLPLVGDLKAGGQTPVQIEDEITKALTKYIVKPLVTVTVQEVGSRRYYMDGQIARPGEYPLVVPTTVLEAISKAGGPLEFANSKKIYVLRGDKRIPFNWKEVLKGKRMDQNIQLKPGDIIVIP
jgi:polysaccharide export outer membrane protein